LKKQNKKQKNLSLCFVSPHAYPVISGSDHKSVGGTEFQQASIARELTKKGYPVSFVVGDFGQPELECIDGIKIYRSFKLFQGNMKLKYPINMLSLMKAMSKAKADVYLQRAGMFYTGHVAFFCGIKGKKFIYSAGHDRNCNPALQKGMNNLIKKFFRYGLKKATAIIAQSENQKRLFMKYYGLESVVIKSGYHLQDFPFKKKTDASVLWVGKALEWKRPELFFELALRIRDATFDMVCAPAQQHSYYQRLKNEARKISNLNFHGYIPIDRIDSLFEKASIFVNTSSSEGFPNTLLQAWAKYVPVVTLDVDPDECICGNSIGYHSKSFDRLVDDVKTLIKDISLRERMGKAARTYVEREHNIKKIANNYVSLLNNV